MAKTELLRLPRTAQEATALDAERLARNYLLDIPHTPNGYPEATVIIAGLLQLLDAHRDRANRNAERLALVGGRDFAQRYRGALRRLRDDDPA